MTNKGHTDYVSEVLKYYQEKKGSTSLYLTHPTPANLKDASIEACRTRLERKDAMVLKTFFGQDLDMNSFLQAIKKCDRDKFRPLVNFLRKPTIDTHEKNIELLAWLIDFKPRPFEAWKRLNSNSLEVRTQKEEPAPWGYTDDDTKVEPLPTKIDDMGGINSIQSTVSGKNRFNFKTRNVIISVIILTAIGLGIYWTRQERCMYWAGDYYQPISCSQKIEGVSVIALDAEKLNNLKKITVPDTITKKSIGKVWYAKVNGVVEFYTSDGFHPIDYERRLLPVTDYIIKKYIQKN